MRSIFVAGCKLLGLYLTAGTLWFVPQLLGVFAMGAGAPGSIGGDPAALPMLAGIAVCMLLHLGFGLFLLLRTGAVAAFAGVGGEGEAPAAPAAAELLSAGVVLIGLYMIGRGISGLPAGLLTIYGHIQAAGFSARAMGGVLSSLVLAGIGVVFARYPSRVLALLRG